VHWDGCFNPNSIIFVRAAPSGCVCLQQIDSSPEPEEVSWGPGEGSRTRREDQRWQGNKKGGLPGHARSHSNAGSDKDLIPQGRDASGNVWWVPQSVLELQSISTDIVAMGR